MSSGNFVSTRYQSDSLPNDPVMIARVQPETLGLVLGGAANEPGGSTVTLPLRVNISGSNRSLGVKPRTVSLKWSGQPPIGYSANGILRVPILSRALWDAVDAGITTGIYLASSVTVVSKSPERSL